MPGIYRLLLVFALSLSLSACSSMLDWDLFGGDDEQEEDYISEEMMDAPDEDVIYTDEDVIYVDEDGNIVEIEEETLEIDDYGDGPQSGSDAMQDVAPPDTTVYFEYKSLTVPASYIGELQKHADYLRANPSEILNIAGHTDGVASGQYNYELALRRAHEVESLMVGLGAPRSQLTVASYGKERPAASGTDEVANTLNRRAVLTYN